MKEFIMNIIAEEKNTPSKLEFVRYTRKFFQTMPGFVSCEFVYDREGNCNIHITVNKKFNQKKFDEVKFNFRRWFNSGSFKSFMNFPEFFVHNSLY